MDLPFEESHAKAALAVIHENNVLKYVLFRIGSDLTDGDRNCLDVIGTLTSFVPITFTKGTKTGVVAR